MGNSKPSDTGEEQARPISDSVEIIRIGTTVFIVEEPFCEEFSKWSFTVKIAHEDRLYPFGPFATLESAAVNRKLLIMMLK